MEAHGSQQKIVNVRVNVHAPRRRVRVRTAVAGRAIVPTVVAVLTAQASVTVQLIVSA
jgi:hypothetical protein